MPSNALAVIHDDVRALDTARPSLGLLRPIAAPADVLAAQEDTRTMIQTALKNGRDFGKIPGVDKPSLLKPGAERVTIAFGCTTRFRIVAQEIDHDREITYVKKTKIWNNAFKGDRSFTTKEEPATSIGLYRYVVECEIVHRESGQVVGACVASCSSMESKYISRPRDSENTIIKMAEKRAMVGATLTTFGLSEQFTQDVEETARDDAGEDENNGSRTNGTDDAASSTTTNGQASAKGADSEPEAACPVCNGKMWDNRTTKTNPKAPDFKCRDRSCDGVIWPGAWPPKVKELATPAQREMIYDLMSKATLTVKQREKIAHEVADADNPMDSERASYFIGKLNEAIEKAATKAMEEAAAAANSPQRELAPTGSGVKELKELPF